VKYLETLAEKFLRTACQYVFAAGAKNFMQ
jgi:hypothetical protein